MVLRNIHDWGLRSSTRLSGLYVPAMIEPAEVIGVLNKAKVSFVLVGLHGLSGWMKEPRATQDVDVLVANKQVRKAVQALREAFPQLEEKDLPVVVRLYDRETEAVLIDVMKPVQQPYREVFKHTRTVSSGKQRYRIPTLEMAMVMKFSAMSSMYRADEDKFQDAHDFIRLVKNNPDFDRDGVAELAALIYPDAGKDLLAMARRVLAGEKLII